MDPNVAVETKVGVVEQLYEFIKNERKTGGENFSSIIDEYLKDPPDKQTKEPPDTVTEPVKGLAGTRSALQAIRTSPRQIKVDILSTEVQESERKQ